MNWLGWLCLLGFHLWEDTGTWRTCRWCHRHQYRTLRKDWRDA